MTALLTFAFAALVALLATARYRAYAVTRRLVDVPGQRSSHQHPTPTAGGVGIASGVLVTTIACHLWVGLATQWLLLLALGAACAMLGHIDDRRNLAVWIRLLVELALAAVLVGVGGIPSLFGWPAPLLLLCICVGVVGLTNVFNFMDGIDGLAALQGCYLALSAIALVLFTHQSAEGVLPLAAIAGACFGFLRWNWSPAHIFMGDTGSLMLGFLMAGAALFSIQQDERTFPAWLILWAAFLVDTCVTLVHRAWRGEPLYRSHREHLYQRLEQRWGSHARVVVVYLLINICWLFPLALLAIQWPGRSGWVVIFAYTPLVGFHLMELRRARDAYRSS
jgi:Fuc2NAc and GlcNAc transferase